MCSRLPLIAIAVAALSFASSAAESPQAQVAVLVDSSSAAASRYAAAMTVEADAIWRRHGIAVSRAAAGAIAPGAIRLTVTFDAVARQAGHQEGLGAIWFDEAGRPSQVITVDQVAVAARIRQAGGAARPFEAWPSALADVIIARALGRVLAHEIGHFLLASSAHARHGLMRASFDGRQLSEWSRRGFELHGAALPRLRARLARLDSDREPLVASKR